MSARLSALERQCAVQREQQQHALTAVSACLATAIGATGDRDTAAHSTERTLGHSGSGGAGDEGSPRVVGQPATVATPSPRRCPSSASAFPFPSIPPPSSAPSAASAASGPRLSDLCQADKAKVGRLLLSLAQLRQRQQAEAQLQADKERLQEQLNSQLLQHTAALRQYQQRLDRLEQQRAEESDRRKQQAESSAQAAAPLTRAERVMDVQQQQQQRSEAATIDELHRLVAAQQAALTRRMDSILQQADAQPEEHIRTSQRPAPPFYQHAVHASNARSALPHPAAAVTAETSAVYRTEEWGGRIEKENARRVPMPALDATSPPLPLSSLLPQLSLDSSSATSHFPLEPGRERHNPSARTHHPHPPSPSLTGHSRMQRRSRTRVSAAEQRGATQSDCSSEEEEGEERAARSMSPVSRRIGRLLSIQRGGTDSSSENESRDTSRRTTPQCRSQPLTTPHSHSSRHSATDNDDVELDAVLELLNSSSTATTSTGSSSTVASAHYSTRRSARLTTKRATLLRPSDSALQATTAQRPSKMSPSSFSPAAADRSSHLSGFDSTLLDVISAVDTWR